jgi:HlyD family secretion protein
MHPIMRSSLPAALRGRLPRLPLPALLAAVLLIALAVTLLVRGLLSSPSAAPVDGTPVAVQRGDLALSVNATGSVEPRREADLALSVNGIVAEVLVAPGDVVAAGDVLLRLDSRQLTIDLAAADAAVSIAEADLQALRDGADEQQRAEAAAAVAAAQAGLNQTAAAVGAADVAAAQAARDEAQSRLTRLLSGPTADDRARVEAALVQAESELNRQRDLLSSAKTAANLRVESAANAVRNAQTVFAAARSDLQHVQANGTDPRSGRSLNDAGKQDVADAFARAERALADAGNTLQLAQVDYQTAVQNEQNGIAAAEARLMTARADFETLTAGATAETLAAARAALSRAEAELARLTGAARSSAIAQQQANLSAAEARAARLAAEPRSADLARAEARLAQAQAQRDAAQLRLDEATLRAPFAGTVAAVTVAPGEAVSQQAPVVLVDTDRFLIDVTVDEVDIARVAVGQSAEVLFDALGAPTVAATVLRVEPLPSGTSAVTAYRVTLEVDPAGRGVRPGMTASAVIAADSRSAVLLIPAAALRTVDGRTQVDVVTASGDAGLTREARDVTVGLRSEGQVEILSGLNEGEQVLVP